MKSRFGTMTRLCVAFVLFDFMDWGLLRTKLLLNRDKKSYFGSVVKLMEEKKWS